MIANVALPAFFPHSIATLLGIFVIAVIEGWFLKRELQLDYKACYGQSLYANWRSTIVGIPMAWVCWMVGMVPLSIGVSAVGFDVHPLIRDSSIKSMFIGGMMPTEWSAVGSMIAWIILLVPFWYGSVWIESKTIEKRLPECDPLKIRRAVKRGNIASYAILLALGIYGLNEAIRDHPEQKRRYEEFRERIERSREARERAED